MCMTLLEMMGLNSEPFNIPLLKITPRILLALAFLHTEVGVVHTGITFLSPLIILLESRFLLKLNLKSTI